MGVYGRICMPEKWKEPPSEGEYVITIHAIGFSDLIFEDEKRLKDTDIVLSVKEVADGGEWPIKVENKSSEEDSKIKHGGWIENITEINGSTTVDGHPSISFPYAFVKNDPKINKKYQSQIIVEKLRIGDDIYFVEDYELRRCQHPEFMKVQSERSKSVGIISLGEGEIGEGESILCTKCNSIVL